MRSISPPGGKNETFPLDADFCSVHWRRFRRRRQGYKSSPSDLRAESFRPVSAHRSGARLGLILSAFSLISLLIGMGLVNTDAVVLRTYNLAEADRIVLFLTRRAGLVRAVARGARRMKSRFGAALEPFTFVRLD